MKQLGALCCSLLIMSLSVGCSTKQVFTSLGLGAAAGAGIAAVYYAKGDLEADHDRNIESVYKSAVSAVEKRNYIVTSKNVSESSADIKAVIPASGDEKERDLTIKMTRKEENVTHISIRVGVFGDEALSHALLDDIG